MTLENLREQITAGTHAASAEMKSFKPSPRPGLEEENSLRIHVGITVLHLDHCIKKLDEAYASAMQGNLEALGRYTTYARSMAPLLAFEKGLQGSEDTLRLFKLKKHVQNGTLLLSTYFAGRLSQEDSWVVANFLAHCRVRFCVRLGRASFAAHRLIENPPSVRDGKKFAEP